MKTPKPTLNICWPTGYNEYRPNIRTCNFPDHNRPVVPCVKETGHSLLAAGRLESKREPALNRHPLSWSSDASIGSPYLPVCHPHLCLYTDCSCWNHQKRLLKYIRLHKTATETNMISGQVHATPNFFLIVGNNSMAVKIAYAPNYLRRPIGGPELPETTAAWATRKGASSYQRRSTGELELSGTTAACASRTSRKMYHYSMLELQYDHPLPIFPGQNLYTHRGRVMSALEYS